MNKKACIKVFKKFIGLTLMSSSLAAYAHEMPSINAAPAIKKASAPATLSAQLKDLQNQPYDETTYQLAYKTLLYNSHIIDAYHLALIAVSKKPKDLSWHEKLAQTATWVGEYNTAMKEWLYVSSHTKDSAILKKAASISHILGYDLVTIEILKMYLHMKPNDLKELIVLATAQNRVNQPQQALLTLEALNAIYPTRAAYELMATIYQDTDQWDKALKIWEKINATFMPSIKSVMIAAEINYSLKRFKQAVETLKLGIPIAKKTDVDFWQALADLAWLLNDQALAILGYSHLLKDNTSIIKLIELEQIKHPQKALAYSLKGWNQFHNMDYFFSAMYLAEHTKRWDIVKQLLKQLTPKQAEKAQQKSAFWTVQANMYAGLGEGDLQQNLLIQGVTLHPEMAELRANLLFLLENNNSKISWIKTLMQNGYEHNLWQDAVSWEPFADAFDVLNQSYASMIMNQWHLNSKNDRLLIKYAHLLEKIKLNQEAYTLWSFLWQKTLSSLRPGQKVSKESSKILSQVAPHEASGTTQVQLLTNLFTTALNDEDLVILLNWMVARNYFELITYFKTYYFHNRLPIWAGTELAMAHNDRPALQKIIEHTDIVATRSDMIKSAVRMENEPLALDLAFKELTERPMANDTYSDFTQYGLANANFINIAEEYEQFVNVIGPRTKIETRNRLNNSWKIRSNISLWKPRSTDLNTIVNVPKDDFQSHLKLEQKIHRGHLSYHLGYREDLNSFIPAAVDGDYLLAAKWTAKFKLGYNQENYQNAYMREGGVQDQINFGLTNTITKYDSLQLELQGLNYYSQDRHYLANGYILEGLYEHKFWLSYPDYTIGIFGNIYHFNRNGSFGGDVTTLFPTLSPEDQATPGLIALTNAAYYQALIPDNYKEGGFTFSFGNTMLDYSHAWRPYAWVSLYYNTITSLSNTVKLGINGSVFGRDSLLVYAERGTAQASQNATNYMVGLRYMMYY